MTEQLIMDAAKVVLEAGMAHPMFLSEVEPAKQNGDLNEFYTEVMAVPIYEDSAERVGPWIGARSYRMTTRYVSTSEDGARQMRERTIAALEFVPLVVAGGETTTPVKFETGTDIGQDSGQWSGADNWTVRL